MKPKSMKNRSRDSTQNEAQKQSPKNQKILEKWLQSTPKKWRQFGGNAYWVAFGGPNRFCNEKVGPQRSQSAPKNEKLATISEK